MEAQQTLVDKENLNKQNEAGGIPASGLKPRCRAKQPNQCGTDTEGHTDQNHNQHREETIQRL
jgi:hypothetical protein